MQTRHTVILCKLRILTLYYDIAAPQYDISNN